MKSELTGTVLCGANNIFTVRSETPAPAAPGETYECRIKGKILKNAEADYNPLCPGDSVCFLPAPETHGAARREGVLLSRGERKNVLLRWNKKGRGAQAIAANVDLLVCIASPVSPPFRPRFLDRLLIAASLTSIPAALCINKCGQGTDEDMEERLADYASRGLPIVRTELTPPGQENLASLGELIRGKRVVFAGQSGVGKTSILNRLAGAKGKVG
ncbi:MAG: GTPase RsgA, partial [Spirochaetales bacterium]|nr:GTPase RsgA [Spirochaetales bacterium]